MNILEHTSGRLQELVGEGLELLIKNCGINKDYGYFSVFDTTDGGSFMLIMKIGFPPQVKNAKYLMLSQEKAIRLFSHPGHSMSWESRNEQENKWGGAVRGVSEIFSFSGLPELADEALMLFVLHKTGQMFNRRKILRMAAISNNTYVAKII